ncbi:hypothetical protein FFLO_00976 [Filobasidium floriforme]|uniref:Uncharacterized protein n=1 Tax=Filobasidium floriforme TaxID=5210 RepID=A0A8K0JQB8_9TREE|nr:hypothetical protein FFLO_00976 [Filobasidium floriforme]
MVGLSYIPICPWVSSAHQTTSIALSFYFDVLSQLSLPLSLFNLTHTADQQLITMSWADVAKKNAPPESEQPHPDQALLEGQHFEGETPAQHGIGDHGVQVIDRDTFENPAPAEPVKAETLQPLDLNSSPAPNDPANTDPRTSSSAPKATDAPKGSEIKVPSAQEVGKKVDESVEKGKQTAKDAEEKGKQVAKDAEAKGKAAARDVEKKAERAADKVEETAKEVKGASKQLARDAEVKGKELVDNAAEKTKEVANDVEKKAKQLKREAKAEIQHAENVAAQYIERAKELVLRPGALGGLMGVANVGLLGTIGYYAYTRRNVPWDRNYVGATAASVLALFGIEGVVAEQFAQTPEGKEEIARAKQEGSKFYVNAREVILRPGVAGGLLGAVNVAVLSAVGYLGYQNWDRRVWDRKIVAGIVSGLISLSAVEGLAGNVWKQKREGKA